jgi:hypothetical protein
MIMQLCVTIPSQVLHDRHHFNEQNKESFIITTVVINSGYLKM